MRRRKLAILSAAAVAALAVPAAVVLAPNSAEAAVTQTASCTDAGGHVWSVHTTWGAVSSTGKVAVTATGFSSAAADATTADWSMHSVNPNGTDAQVTGGQDTAFNFDGGRAFLERDLADPTSGGARVTVNVGDGNDGKANCSVAFTQPAPAPSSSSAPPPASPSASATAAAPVIVDAVGDIACTPSGAVTSSTCQQKAVGAKILADKPAAFLALGDLQYESGSAAEFKAYDAAFAPLKPVTRPVPGNHEYRTAGASGYYGYFGARAGDPAKGYYSFNLGGWHFVALNSEKDITAGGAQLAWLKADLAADNSACTAAFWHRPRWSTGAEHGDATDVQPFIDALYAARADLVLNGHDHDYERFHPLNPQGQIDRANGLTQIVSGLGGKNRYAVAGRATTAAKNSSGFGFTRLALRPDGADVSYVPAVGTFTDKSTLACHNAPPPVVPAPPSSAAPSSVAPSAPPASSSVPVEPPASSSAPVEPPASSSAPVEPPASSSAPVEPPASSSAPAESPAPPATDPASTTAAATFGWGAPFASDEFEYVGAPDPLRWSVYNSAGHAGKGLRRTEAWRVADGYARVTGDSAGTTGGMSFRPDRGTVYGRWEARSRKSGDSEYHPVLIVWPDAQRIAANDCQEIDYQDPGTSEARARVFLHHNCSGGQTTASTPVDVTQWHNYAVEWTASHVIGYVDGREYFRDELADHIPRDPSHQTVQLDWFPDGTPTTPSTMDVDWIRVYRLA